jgi:nucleotide-binding universal stress UspA family protein
MELPEVKIKKILYATDLSENARLAFAYAVSLANLYCAGLTMVHVIAEDPDLDEKVIGYISAERWAEIKKRNFQEAEETLTGKLKGGLAIKDVLERFCEKAQAGGVTFEKDEILVLKGNPVEQILNTARDKSFDLIVMGSHGYGTLQDAMMGGTARRVLRRAKVPVLLVRLPED